MHHPIRLALLLSISVALGGCLSTATRRDNKFQSVKGAPRILLVLVGGNSECGGENGLWPVRERIAASFAASLGMARDQLSTDYVAWTGDDADHPGCLPGGLDYLSGHLAIANRIASYGPAGENSMLAIVGWSNGGATAAQLSHHLDKQSGTRQVDLLVTLDPVSRLTERPENAGAKTWLNVYTQSSGFDKLRSDNVIAAAGGAWNAFAGPDMVECMKGNHGEAAKMWDAVVMPSLPFREWAESARRRFNTAPETPTLSTMPSYEACSTNH